MNYETHRQSLKKANDTCTESTQKEIYSTFYETQREGGRGMKVYATTPYALSKLQLYTSKVKAHANRKPDEVVVELEVDEYPTIEELQAWLNTLTNPENLPEIDTVLRRAGGYGLMWEVLYSAHERQDEPDFEIVDALQEACYRWDV